MAFAALALSRGERDMPSVPAPIIGEFLRTHHGIDGALRPLVSERDQIVYVTDEQGRATVLRISSPNEAAEAIALQNALLAAVARQDPSLPVPRILSCRTGQATGRIAGHVARLYSFLDGVPVTRTRRSPALRAALGIALARLGRALASCDEPGICDPFPWNVLRACELRARLDDVRQPAARALAQRALDDFCGSVLPRLHAMPHQFIHNDFNPKNVLVSIDDPERVSGIIDFGDAMRAPRVIDLGVAIARQVTQDDPVTEGCEILAAYHGEAPLLADEIDLLIGIVRARLAMRVTIWGWRQASGSGPVDASLIDDAAGLLESFERTGRDVVTDRFRAAAAKA